VNGVGECIVIRSDKCPANFVDPEKLCQNLLPITSREVGKKKELVTKMGSN